MHLLFISYIPLGYNGFTRNYLAYNLAIGCNSISVSHLVRKSSRALIVDKLAEIGKVDYISPVQIAKAICSRKYHGIFVFNKNGLFFSRLKADGKGWSRPRFLSCFPDLSQYRFSKDLSELYRCAFSLENTFVVGQVGDFTKANNQNFTLSVFRNLQKTHSNAHLLFVGDGPMRMELNAQIDYEYLPALMPGDTLSMHTMLSAMDVLLFPSGTIDPYLMTEAQASGLLCIVPSHKNEIKSTESIIKRDLDERLWAQTIGTLHIDMSAREKRSQDFLDSQIKAEAAKLDIIRATVGTSNT